MTALDTALSTLAGRAASAGLSVSEPRPIQYGVQLSLSDGAGTVTVNLYSGKKGLSAVVTGKAGPLKDKVQVLAADWISGGSDGRKTAPASAGREMAGGGYVHGFEGIAGFDGRWIGTDESGKGDFFGPLVIAGVWTDTAGADALARAGARDSKLLNDRQAATIAAAIRELCPGRYVELEIRPKRYNELYEQFRGEGKNLNHLLAWAHARVMEELLSRCPSQFVIADKFADESFIQNRLMTLGRKVTLVQTPRAERNVAVAAASILARDVFVRRLAALGTAHGIALPKGASSAVEEAGRRFVAEKGRQALGEVAKLHFRTAEKLAQSEE